MLTQSIPSIQTYTFPPYLIQISLALVTNCDIPLSLARYLTVIIPIHSNDLFNITSKQWQTRLLYNAYLPFNYNFIIDSHVFPCDSLAIPELFHEFAVSNVDIAFGNRMNIPDRVLGACILSRWGEGSYDFWKRYRKILCFLRA